MIRIGVISPDTGKPQLLNFVAIEPVIFGAGSRFSRMAFSELESSTLDSGLRGKRLMGRTERCISRTMQIVANSPKQIERLSVRINVERFTANGADVYVVAAIDSDQPGEVKFSVHQANDSSPIEQLTLTATMGNFEPLRWLFLKHRVLVHSSKALSKI